MFGFLCVNKPVGMSSRQAVDRVKRWVRPAKIGHAGTLDPLASGVLVLGIGPATRLMKFVQQQTKYYRGTFQLGVSSATDDLEGELIKFENPPLVDSTRVQGVLPEFTGKITQVPPAYSAVKINGQRAYRLARKGQDVHVKSREVHVHSIELTRFDYPDIELLIQCGSGTYIRSIGRDLGKRLNSAAVMTGLVRTQVGPFKIDQAVLPDEVDLRIVEENLVPAIDIFCDLHRAPLNRQQIHGLRNGTFFPAAAFPEIGDADQIAVTDARGRLLALLSRRGDDRFKPELNFVHSYDYQSFEDS